MLSSLILAASLTGGVAYDQAPCCYLHCPVRRTVAAMARVAVVAPAKVAKAVVVQPVQDVRQRAAQRLQRPVLIQSPCAGGQCGRAVWRRRR